MAAGRDACEVFNVYKALEPGKRSEVRGWQSRADAEATIRDAFACAGADNPSPRLT